MPVFTAHEQAIIWLYSYCHAPLPHSFSPSTSLSLCVSRLFRAVRFDKGKYDVNIKTTGKSSPEFAPYPTHSAKKDAERQRQRERMRKSGRERHANGTVECSVRLSFSFEFVSPS